MPRHRDRLATVHHVSGFGAVPRVGDAQAPHGLERIVVEMVKALDDLVAESRRPGDSTLCSASIVKCVAALAVLVGPDQAERAYERAQSTTTDA